MFGAVDNPRIGHDISQEREREVRVVAMLGVEIVGMLGLRMLKRNQQVARLRFTHNIDGGDPAVLEIARKLLVGQTHRFTPFYGVHSLAEWWRVSHIAGSQSAVNVALLSATEQCHLVAEGELSAVELLDACLAQYERHNPTLNAIIHEEIDAARTEARAADDARVRGGPGGPLDGLPITVKDSIDWAGRPSTWGDPQHRDHRPTEDASVLAQLRAAGAIVWGKTNVPLHLAEWQTFNSIHGRTNNPWDVDRTPGGSSGGSAVAVATGMAALEVGSDIGGSVRWPAAHTGITGLKPSYGLISQHGHTFPGQEGTVDHNVIGPIARTIADLELVLPPMHEPYISLRDPSQASLSDFTVGVLLDNPVGDQDAAVTATIQAAIDQLSDAGLGLAEPPPMDLLLTGQSIGQQLGRAAASGPNPPPPSADVDRYDEGSRDYDALIAHASRMTHREWMSLNDERERTRLRWRDYFRTVDLLLTPIAATTAPPHDERSFAQQRVVVNGVERSIAEQWFWAGIANVTYQPAVSFPAGCATDGLPVGMQAVGPFMSDRTVLRFGALAETVLGCPLTTLHARW